MSEKSGSRNEGVRTKTGFGDCREIGIFVASAKFVPSHDFAAEKRFRLYHPISAFIRGIVSGSRSQALILLARYKDFFFAFLH